MKSLIEEMYYRYMDGKNVSFKNLRSSEKERAAHDEIYSLLNEKQQELFNEYIDAFGLRHCDLQEEIYALGFRMGAQMILEMFGVDFTQKEK